MIKKKRSIKKVLLIGLDAAGWNVALPLVKKGKLPNFKKLMKSGVYGNLTTIDPNLSPVIWTSIATGKVKEKHGVDRFFMQQGEKKVPLTSNVRKAKAIWDILSERGKTVSVIGWWNTWPAEKVKGAMVSSYVKEPIKLGKGCLYPDIPSQTYPPKLKKEISKFLNSGEKNAKKIFAEQFKRIPKEMINKDIRDSLENVKLNYIRDETFTQIGLYLQKKYKPDFLTVYLGGIDNAGHCFWKYMRPTSLNFHVSKKEQEFFGKIIPEYYFYIDDAIGRLINDCEKDTLITIVSDHGMRATYSYTQGRTGSHRGDDPGIFIISGPNIKKFHHSPPFNTFQNRIRQLLSKYVESRVFLFDDAAWFQASRFKKGNKILGLIAKLFRKFDLIKYVSIFDITPTILYSLGLPVAKDMDGKIFTYAFTSQFLNSNPPSYIKSYESYKKTGKIKSNKPIESAVDQKIIERLRQLGYF